MRFTSRQLKFAILEVLATIRKGHRYNTLGGRSHDRGDLERRLDVDFDDPERRQADAAFSQLLNAAMIQSTYDDLVDPANWVRITDGGKAALHRRTLDDLDEALSKIAPHLVDVREGAWSALSSELPDAARQAAHSARELIDQVLKEGAPDSAVRAESWFKPDSTSKTGITRKHRLRYLMNENVGNTSDTDLREAEAACELVHASDARLMAMSHARSTIADLDDETDRRAALIRMAINDLNPERVLRPCEYLEARIGRLTNVLAETMRLPTAGTKIIQSRSTGTRLRACR